MAQVLPKIEIMCAEARNARLLLALGKVKAEGGREVTQRVHAMMCLAWKSQQTAQQTT